MGTISVTAIAILENPRTISRDKPKSFVFDAQIWVPTEDPLIAGLRFFNKDSLQFNATVNKCLITANVVRMTKDVYPLLNSTLEIGDYDLYGDIVQLIPLPDSIDPRIVPFVQGAGTTDESMENAFTMDLQPRLANVDAAWNLDFPMKGHFRDLERYARYSNGKPPVPGVRSIAAFTGLLTSTTGREDGKTPDRFHIDVEGVTFLGRSALPIPRNYEREGPKTPKSATPGKMSFDFNALGSPETPTKKRKTRHTNAEAGPST